MAWPSRRPCLRHRAARCGDRVLEVAGIARQRPTRAAGTPVKKRRQVIGDPHLAHVRRVSDTRSQPRVASQLLLPHVLRRLPEPRDVPGIAHVDDDRPACRRTRQHERHVCVCPEYLVRVLVLDADRVVDIAKREATQVLRPAIGLPHSQCSGSPRSTPVCTDHHTRVDLVDLTRPATDSVATPAARSPFHTTSSTLQCSRTSTPASRAVSTSSTSS